MPVVMLLAVLAVLAGVVVVATGRGGEMSREPADYAPLDMGKVSATDVVLLRPPTAVWGYSMQVTEAALEKIANAIRERDVRIIALEQRISDLTGQEHYAPRPPGSARAGSAPSGSGLSGIGLTRVAPPPATPTWTGPTTTDSPSSVTPPAGLPLPGPPPEVAEDAAPSPDPAESSDAAPAREDAPPADDAALAPDPDPDPASGQADSPQPSPKEDLGE